MSGAFSPTMNRPIIGGQGSQASIALAIIYLADTLAESTERLVAALAPPSDDPPLFS